MKNKRRESDWKFLGWEEVAPRAFKQRWVRKPDMENCIATFDADASVITMVLPVNDTEALKASVHIEPDTKQSALVKALFARPAGKYESWDVLYEEMAGEDSPGNIEAKKRMVMDARDAINGKVREQLRVDEDFIDRKNLNLCRRC